MNLANSSGGRKSPMWCFPSAMFVSSIALACVSCISIARLYSRRKGLTVRDDESQFYKEKVPTTTETAKNKGQFIH